MSTTPTAHPEASNALNSSERGLSLQEKLARCDREIEEQLNRDPGTGRRAIVIELKESYYKQAVLNLARAETEAGQELLPGMNDADVVELAAPSEPASSTELVNRGLS